MVTLMTYISQASTFASHISDVSGRGAAGPARSARADRTHFDLVALDLDVLDRDLVAFVLRHDSHATVDGEHVLDADLDTLVAAIAA